MQKQGRGLGLILVVLGATPAVGAGSKVYADPRAFNSAASAAELIKLAAQPTCAPLGKYRAPRVGTRFVYQATRHGASLPSSSITEIRTSRGDYVEERQSATMPGLPPSPGVTRTSLAILIPGPAPGNAHAGTRDYKFPKDAPERVKTLRPGASVSFKGSETTNFEGVRRTVAGTHTVAFRGCGQLRIGSRVEPVNIYEVSSFGRLFSNRPGNKFDRVDPSRARVFVSPRHGWWVRREGEEGLGLALSRVETPT